MKLINNYSEAQDVIYDPSFWGNVGIDVSSESEVLESPHRGTPGRVIENIYVAVSLPEDISEWWESYEEAVMEQLEDHFGSEMPGFDEAEDMVRIYDLKRDQIRISYWYDPEDYSPTMPDGGLE